MQRLIHAHGIAYVTYCLLIFVCVHTQDKEKTEEKLTREMTEMENSLLQQVASFEDQNTRLRVVLEQKEQEIERLMSGGTTYSRLQNLDFDNDTVIDGHAYDDDAHASLQPGMDGTNTAAAGVPSTEGQPPRAQSTLPPLGAGAEDVDNEEDDDGQRPMSV